MFCDLCGAEIRWPDYPEEVDLEDGTEVVLCPDCYILDDTELDDA